MSTGVKVFAATRPEEIRNLGDVVTEWLRSHPEFEITSTEINQSSAAQFHCLTITLSYTKIQNKETNNASPTSTQTKRNRRLGDTNKTMGKRKP